MSLSALRAKLAAKIAEDDLLSRFAKGGAAALFIKLGAAGFSFLMFLLLARAASVEGYGQFGFAFSAATLLSVAGSFGQRMTVLRWAPVYHEDGRAELLTGIIRYGYAWVVGGCLAMGLLAMLAGWIDPSLGGPVFLALAALLVLADGLAEYQARVLRAVSGMVLALAPRDIGWRLGVMAVAGAWLLADLPPMSGEAAVGITGAVLLAVVIGQAMLHPATRPHALLRAPAHYEAEAWNRASLSLWGVSLAQILGPNFSVVLVGMMLADAETAGFFAALRVAMLMELFPLAAQMVSASMIASAYAKGDMGRLQKVCKLMALAAAAPAAAAFALFLLAGDWIMGLFGDGFEDAGMLLAVVSLGFFGKSVMGQAAVVMQLAGEEKRFMRISAICNAGGVLLVAAAIPLFGVMGAAAATSLGMLSWTIWSQRAVMARLGVDTSILAVLRR